MHFNGTCLNEYRKPEVENRKYVFERQLDGDDQNNAILAPGMNCHDPGRFVAGETHIQSVFLIVLKSFPSVSLLISVKQNVDKINSILTCLRRLHFRGMAAGFYHVAGFFIAMQSVKRVL